MTKSFISAAIVFLCVSVSGCDKPLDFRNADISNKKIYVRGENTGHSGKVTNIPLSSVPFDSIIPVTNILGKATGNKFINDYLYLNSLSMVQDGGILCDTNTNNGIFNGEMSCKIKSSNNPFLRLNYENNLIDGEVTFFYPKKSGQRFASVTYSKDQPNGKLVVYSFTNGNPTYKLDWSNGIMTGEEEGFDDSTGKPTFKAQVTNGNRNGDFLKYDSNGKVSEKIVFDNGVQLQSQQGTVIQKAAPQDCVDSWISAFRKESSPDSPVHAAQIEEWESWCSNGKHPAA